MGFLDIIKGVVNTGIKFIASEWIEKQLDKLIKKTIVNSVIKQMLFLAAILISYVSLGVLFGKSVSLLISSITITGLLLHSLIRTLPMVWAILKIIVKHKGFILSFIKGVSPSEIIADFVYSCHPLVFMIKARLDEKLRGWVPTADDLVEYVWGYVGKRALIFVISLAVFFISFYFIAKPILLRSVIGISGLKIYLSPFAMAIDYLFKTEIMQWVIEF
jgi:hypothetical protein